MAVKRNHRGQRMNSRAHRDVWGQCSTWGHAELCGQCLGVVRQEYGRGVGGSNLRLGRPKPAFGVSHSTTFSNCCSHASQTLKMALEFSESAQLASRLRNMEGFGPSTAIPDRGK